MSQVISLKKYQTVKMSAPTNSNGSRLADAMARGELILSLSSLLGCDYIFISHRGMHELLQPRNANKTIYEILRLMDTAPLQSMIVGADLIEDGSYAFTRYEYVWEKGQIKQVSIVPVINSEQVEFMQTMFGCSSVC